MAKHPCLLVPGVWPFRFRCLPLLTRRGRHGLREAALIARHELFDEFLGFLLGARMAGVRHLGGKSNSIYLRETKTRIQTTEGASLKRRPLASEN